MKESAQHWYFEQFASISVEEIERITSANESTTLSVILSAQLGDLSPFDFFRQESSNTDVVVRTEAMMKITVVVALMGPERARNEMLPYLQSKPIVHYFTE